MIGILDTLTNIFSGIHISKLVKGEFKFSSSVYYQNNIYFIPYDAPMIGVLNTSTHKFSTISLHNYVRGQCKFNGSILYHDTIYMAPANLPIIGVYHIPNNDFKMINVDAHVKGKYKFSTIVKYQDVLLFIPYFCGKMVVLNVKKQKLASMELGEEWSKQACWDGCVVVDNKVYFCPHDGHVVGVLNIND